jgi:hypothetical protein
MADIAEYLGIAMALSEPHRLPMGALKTPVRNGDSNALADLLTEVISFFCFASVLENSNNLPALCVLSIAPWVWSRWRRLRILRLG